MEPWRVDHTNLRRVDARRVTALHNCCLCFNYKEPVVGYCRVPRRAWCRNYGSYAAHFTLRSSSSTVNFGIITSFTCYGNSVNEAVEKLVNQAIDFILWRARELNLYG